MCQGTVFSRGFLGNGGQYLMERATFLLHYRKEQTQRTFMSTGTNELSMGQQKVHLPGGSWAGKTRLCVDS